MIRYSAPAKIILSGEHAVVYGKPAFVSAIDLRLTCTVQEATADTQAVDETFVFVKNVVLAYLKRKDIKYTEVHLTYQIDSAIPKGRGLGSSAAFCVALSACLYHAFTATQPDKQVINTLAYQAEQQFHGMPSGVDVSASTQGGLIFYRKEFEFLKNISALNFKLPKNIVDKLILIDSGKPIESTAEMVKLVGKRYNEQPQLMEKTLMRTEKMTKRMVVAAIKEDVQLFADTIAENQQLLIELGIVSSSTQQLLSQLNQYGAGKVTGAGGAEKSSGYILFLTNDKEQVVKFLDNEKLQYFDFKQDFEGVRFIPKED